MQVTEISCDRCKAAFKNTDPQDKHFATWQVCITLDGYKTAGVNPQEWCRACCVKIGLIPPNSASEKRAAPPQPPTLETLIGDLVDKIRDEAGAAARDAVSG